MCIATHFSRKLVGLSKPEVDRTLALVRRFGLPTEIPENIDSDALLNAMERDKKIEAGICHFVLLKSIGDPVIHPVTVEELRQSLDDMTA
jgi:3-dehydroquinate synthase